MNIFNWRLQESTIIGLRIRARGTTLVDLPGYRRRGARVGNSRHLARVNHVLAK